MRTWSLKYEEEEVEWSRTETGRLCEQSVQIR